MSQASATCQRPNPNPCGYDADLLDKVERAPSEQATKASTAPTHGYSTTGMLRALKKSGDLYYTHIVDDKPADQKRNQEAKDDKFDLGYSDNARAYAELMSQAYTAEGDASDGGAQLRLHGTKIDQDSVASYFTQEYGDDQEKGKDTAGERSEKQETAKAKEEKSKNDAGTNKPRMWNEEHQAFFAQGAEHYTYAEVNKLSELFHDFVECAGSYAKIIVNELGLAENHKTIKPIALGGVAGGLKYVVHGILFKFCLDSIVVTKPKVVYMYGGDSPRDDYAMKAGGLELQGMESWASQAFAGLHCPLMALIDYKGFRLVATSLLPIHGQKTLRYGSADAGRTVLAEDQKLNELIKSVAQRKNLKGHTVGANRTLLYGPGDIEGHLGTDGRYYLLDFARTMPPEAPKLDAEGQPVEPRAIFYKMLRPELLYSNKVPLSSDVFSGWGQYDEDIATSQWEVTEATLRITEERVPLLAAGLISTYDLDAISDRYFSSGTTTPKRMHKLVETVKLPLRMHCKGINLRYVGHLRQQMLHVKEWRVFLLSWALARLLRQKLRARLRETIRTVHSSEIACKRVVATFFNDVLFGRDRRHTTAAKNDDATAQEHSPWADLDMVKEIEAKYECILTDKEKKRSDFSEWSASALGMRLVIAELLHLKTIKLAPSASAMLFECRDFGAIKLVERDIAEICAKVRYPHYHNIMDAVVSQSQAAAMATHIPLPSASKTAPFSQMSDRYRVQASLPKAAEKRPSAADGAERKDGCRPATEEASARSVQRAQANRLLKRAEQSLYDGYVTYPLCHLTPLLWGRTRVDRAVVAARGPSEGYWQKARRLFKRAEDKYASAMEVGGAKGACHAVNRVLLEAWAEALSVHADEAERRGLWAEAAQLRARAKEKMDQAAAAQKASCSGAKLIVCGEATRTK